MRTFDVSTRSDGSTVVLEVAGSVDAVTAVRLADELQAQLDAGRPRVVVDLGAVSYVSSAALRVLLAAVKGARGAGGDLRLAAVAPGVAKVFGLAGFDAIVQRYDDAAAAVASFT